MFWRNPSAAFFGFLLPLGLLAIFGAVFAGRDEDLDVIVPGIAGMSVMSATFTSLAYNLTTLRERGILKRLRGTPLPTSAYLAGLAGNAVANAALQIVIIIVAGHVLFGVGVAAATGSRSRVFVARGRRLLRAARRRALARDPEPRVGAGVRQRRVPAADPDLGRVLRRRRRAARSSATSRRRCRSSTWSTGCRARWSTARASARTRSRCSCSASGPRSAPCSRCAASPGKPAAISEVASRPARAVGSAF